MKVCDQCKHEVQWDTEDEGVFREQITKEIEEIKESGVIVELPFD